MGSVQYRCSFVFKYPPCEIVGHAKAAPGSMGHRPEKVFFCLFAGMQAHLRTVLKH